MFMCLQFALLAANQSRSSHYPSTGASLPLCLPETLIDHFRPFRAFFSLHFHSEPSDIRGLKRFFLFCLAWKDVRGFSVQFTLLIQSSCNCLGGKEGFYFQPLLSTHGLEMLMFHSTGPPAKGLLTGEMPVHTYGNIPAKFFASRPPLVSLGRAEGRIEGSWGTFEPQGWFPSSTTMLIRSLACHFVGCLLCWLSLLLSSQLHFYSQCPSPHLPPQHYRNRERVRE